MGFGARAARFLYPPPPPPKNRPDFHIAFRFRSLSRAPKADLVRFLGLSEHASRLSGIGESRKDLDLAESLCLDELRSGESLPVLFVEETSTMGMYGPWRGAESKLYKALVGLGHRGGSAETGGSFGFGKVGLIRGSRPRILVAYTSFRERPDDPGVTRRLLGVTYWGAHRSTGADCTGMAFFDSRAADGPRPFENEEADRIASDLGLQPRRPAGLGPPDDLGTGTSFLLIEPTITPDDLEQAVVRSWWPALEDESLPFDVTIEREDGSRVSPRPRRDSDFRPFVEACGHAGAPPSKGIGNDPNRRIHRIHAGDQRTLAGTLALITSPEWSFPDESGGADEAASDESLVALMRRPRMVVEYLSFGFRGAASPIVRGVFVADDGVNRDLRDTEPWLHDAWNDKGDDNRPARELAAVIRKRIRQRVADFRKALRPPPPKRKQVALPVFDRIMRKIVSGTGRSRPIPETRPLSIETDIRRRPSGAGFVCLEGSVWFALSEHCDRDRAPVTVRIRVGLVEDDRAGDSIGVEVQPPNGFRKAGTRRTARYSGELDKDSKRRFRFESDPYRADWTARLQAEGKIDSGGSA